MFVRNKLSVMCSAALLLAAGSAVAEPDSELSALLLAASSAVAESDSELSAALLLAAGSAVAESDSELLYSGNMELSAGWANLVGGSGDTDADDHDYGLIAGAGRASIPVGTNTSIQLDIGGLSNFTARRDSDGGDDFGNGDGDSQYHNNFHGGVHFSYRDTESYAAGVFGQFGSSEGGDDEDATYWAMGAEGQKYLENTTLYGQVGHFQADDGDERDVMTDAWFLRGVVRHFLDEKSMVSVELAYADGEENHLDDGDLREDYDAFSWGARYERMFSQNPMAWFVEYRGTEIKETHHGSNESNDDNGTEHVVSVGVKMYFGVGSLKENDRRGATFDQPDIGRWTGMTIDALD
jgi:hypothetical protein